MDKNQDPVSGINVPDPQHCFNVFNVCTMYIRSHVISAFCRFPLAELLIRHLLSIFTVMGSTNCLAQRMPINFVINGEHNPSGLRSSGFKFLREGETKTYALFAAIIFSVSRFRDNFEEESCFRKEKNTLKINVTVFGKCIFHRMNKVYKLSIFCYKRMV